MKSRKQVAAVFLFVFGSMVSAVCTASEPIFVAEVTADFADVSIDIENAIANRGFVVDFNSNISDMLNRTAADVGSTNPVYIHAETWQFCSSILSRKMVEVNPVNVAYCPYIVFAYETVDRPGRVEVGYRPHDVEDDASEAILEEIDNQLKAIVKEADE